jgi:hypothetical protein
VFWQGLTRHQAQRLLFVLFRMGHQQRKIPLYSDVSFTTAPSSGTTINCPTADRRFVVGQEVLISADDGTGGQFRTISAVGVSTITVSLALIGSYPAKSTVYPVLQAEVLLDGVLAAETDGTCSIEATFGELLEGSIPGSKTYETLTGDQAAHPNGEDYFVLAAPVEWGEDLTIAMERSGNQVTLGRDQATHIRGPRPRLRFEFEVTQTSREEHTDLLEFFDAHRGRLIPFFFVNPLTVWQAEAIGTSTVDVEPGEDVDDPLSFVEFVVIMTTAGATHVREVMNVQEIAGPLWRLTLGAAIPALTIEQVERVSTAHFVRFASDSLEEEWETDQVCVSKLSLVEVLGEQEVAIE